MMQLKLVDVPVDQWLSVTISARHFVVDFPDHFGVRNGVGYWDGKNSYYIYRTKTQIVVRGQ